MIDATWKLKKLAASVIRKPPFDAAVSCDIQNAFNLMSWMQIMDKLENSKGPVYLRSIIGDYFQNWVVLATNSIVHD